MTECKCFCSVSALTLLLQHFQPEKMLKENLCILTALFKLLINWNYSIHLHWNLRMTDLCLMVGITRPADLEHHMMISGPWLYTQDRMVHEVVICINVASAQTIKKHNMIEKSSSMMFQIRNWHYCFAKPTLWKLQRWNRFFRLWEISDRAAYFHTVFSLLESVRIFNTCGSKL